MTDTWTDAPIYLEGGPYDGLDYSIPDFGLGKGFVKLANVNEQHHYVPAGTFRDGVPAYKHNGLRENGQPI